MGQPGTSRAKHLEVHTVISATSSFLSGNKIMNNLVDCKADTKHGQQACGQHAFQGGTHATTAAICNETRQ